MYTAKAVSFRGLQNYTTLKLQDCFQYEYFRFRGLQNYTTLKHPSMYTAKAVSFRGLQNYTTLKQTLQRLLSD